MRTQRDRLEVSMKDFGFIAFILLMLVGLLTAIFQYGRNVGSFEKCFSVEAVGDRAGYMINKRFKKNTVWFCELDYKIQAKRN